MLDKKGQYINLKERSESGTNDSEKRYRLFSPLVQLSGSKRGKGRKISRGITLQQREESDRSPLIDLPAVFKALVYGISFLVFVIGNFFKNPGGKGHMNGGQA